LIAIAFHQCFEGVALGGCLLEAEYSTRAYAAMAAAYSLTTPVGVAIGIGIRAAYNPNSATALGVTGAFDAVAAGILVYMALVDLVAVDFMSAKFRAETRLQVAGYGGLIVGAAAMTVLALWA
jgi:solute carrier family 39 (zinc transporter), member 1/2/3